MGSANVGTNRHSNIDPITGEVTEAFNDMTFEERTKDLEKQEKAEERRQKKAKNSPYKSFTQLNIDQIDNILALSKKDHVASEIVMFLIKHCDRTNALVCSSRVLEEALGYDRTTIYKAKKLLKETGFIDIKKSGSTDVFLLNKDVAWKSYGTNYQFGEFEAKIIISKSEQEDKVIVKDKKINMVEIKENKQSATAV